MSPPPLPEKLGLPLVCSDYDEDCLGMDADEAAWCFMGMTGCRGSMPALDVGIADGYCPMIDMG